MTSMGLRFNSQTLEILDQRLLPDQEHWVHVTSTAQMIDLIQGLAVRGAPLIGVATAAELARLATSLEPYSPDRVREAAADLRQARPTAVNLQWAMDRMVQDTSSAARVMAQARQIFDEDVAMCLAMGRHGAALIDENDGVLTICNTGGLATAGVGTALSVIQQAWDQGRRFHVYFCETRPLLQGGRLTAWELKKLGIPHTLICDGMAASLMRARKIQKCFVGADRIAANGDFANKIGTYSLAVLCQHHQIPFYPVAPLSTVDWQCASGQDIPIEQRAAKEVRGFGDLRWAPSDCAVVNPSFDVTPAELVRGLVLNTGLVTVERFRAARQLQVAEASC